MTSLSRREFLKLASVVAALPATRVEARESGFLVNDIHAQINPTRVRAIVQPRSEAELIAAVRRARRSGGKLSLCGGRHSMGGQQFGTGTTLLDLRSMNDVLHFDRQRGIVEVESGIEWPKLINYLVDRGSWAIAQKQTGADALTIGGALASNVHGRGLTMKPIVSDIESFTLIDSEGRAIRCSREENIDRFRLAIGGYGLFGVVSSGSLRLLPRRQPRRVFGRPPVHRHTSRLAARNPFGVPPGGFFFAVLS